MQKITGNAIIQVERARLVWKLSIWRQIKIATAGMSGSTERALTVQFMKAAKVNVPTTQRQRSTESASRHRQTSAMVKAMVRIPPAMKGISFITSHVRSGGGSRPSQAIAIALGTARANATVIHRQRNVSGAIRRTTSTH